MHDLVVSAGFVKPHFIQELGCDGLTSQEIAQSLGMEHTNLLKLIYSLKNSNDIDDTEVYLMDSIGKNAIGGEYKIRVAQVSAEAAKFVVTQSSTKEGRAYCRFLIECEKTVEHIRDNPAIVLQSMNSSQLRLMLAETEAREKAQQEVARLAAANTTLQIKVRDAEGFNCLAGACARFGWDNGTALWRSAMGNLAARIQKQLNTRIEKIPDDRFGTVNAHDDRVWLTIAERCPDFRDIKALYRELGWSTKKITPTKK